MMTLIPLVEGFLYSVATLIYYPVMLGLVALVFYIVYLAGALLREYLERRRGARPALPAFRADLSALLGTVTERHHELEIETLLQDTERRFMAPVDKARFIVRAGPGLGLMGTLIPMGVALAALATGSMPQMAQLMVNAFNSAVVGLGSGVAAFAIALVREQWIQADVLAMRYLSERTLLDGVIPELLPTPGALAARASGELA